LQYAPRSPNRDEGAGAGAGESVWWSLRASALATPVDEQDLRYSFEEKFRAPKQSCTTIIGYASQQQKSLTLEAEIMIR
jgi:hypothetical protein